MGFVMGIGLSVAQQMIKTMAMLTSPPSSSLVVSINVNIPAVAKMCACGPAAENGKVQPGLGCGLGPTPSLKYIVAVAAGESGEPIVVWKGSNNHIRIPGQ